MEAAAGTRPQYQCKLHGCEKTFLRKEHLVRHAQTHTDTHPRYVCQYCLRGFSRSDSLQRHILRHGVALIPTLSGRSRRACNSCHTSKIKCEGRSPCSACLIKGVDCDYERQNVEVRSQQLSRTGEEEVPTSTFIDQMSSTDMRENVLPIKRPWPDPFIEGPSNPINWQAMRIQKDLQPHQATGVEHATLITQNIAYDDATDLWNLPKPVIKKYTDLYFAHFHHRWPIIHRLSFEYFPQMLSSVVIMIGAWFNGSKESRDLATDVHSRLTNHLMPQLSQASSKDYLKEPFPIYLYQTSLLTIIFGLYSGDDTTISKMIIMKSTLITVLREVGFFDPSTSYHDDKLNFFTPLRMVKQGERSRLAAYLHKIDCYFNLLRSQPASLNPEELHLDLPCTFALWDSERLDIWDSRFAVEPSGRSQMTLRKFILAGAPAWANPSENLQLVEDLQSCLCAIQHRIWRLSASATNPIEGRARHDAQKDHLRQELDFIKRKIVQTSIPHQSHDKSSQFMNLHLRLYYGYEDHSKDGWQDTVSERFRGLSSDALMLYHLLGLHVCADILTLREMAKSSCKGNIQTDFRESYENSRQQREHTVREWARSADARRALLHSSEIFILYSNFDVDTSHESKPDDRTLDPIAFIALSIAMLVVWAQCSFGVHDCDLCLAGNKKNRPLDNTSVELATWSGLDPGAKITREVQAWIVNGEDRRVTIHSIQLCRCNIKEHTRRFQTCLPRWWTVTYKIAPCTSERTDTSI